MWRICRREEINRWYLWSCVFVRFRLEKMHEFDYHEGFTSSGHARNVNSCQSSVFIIFMPLKAINYSFFGLIAVNTEKGTKKCHGYRLKRRVDELVGCITDSNKKPKLSFQTSETQTYNTNSQKPTLCGVALRTSVEINMVKKSTTGTTEQIEF